LSPLRGIPTSRAYWDLKADQVLNRVFEPEKPIDLEFCEPPSLFPIPSGIPVELHDHPPTKTNLLLAGACITVMVFAGITLAALSIWNQSQQGIRQERNMLLIERLRTMGPGTSPAQTNKQPQTASANGSTEDGELPPPPPGEPWMEELATLPASSAPAADVLKVPVNSRITSQAPAATGSASSPGGSTSSYGSGGNAPELVGVVQVPGQSGSAIFQLGGSSTSAAVGESIGSSGWRLRSASGDMAVIEKGGEQRRISISSGF
jgi:hypothetical protein